MLNFVAICGLDICKADSASDKTYLNEVAKPRETMLRCQHRFAIGQAACTESKLRTKCQRNWKSRHTIYIASIRLYV